MENLLFFLFLCNKLNFPMGERFWKTLQTNWRNFGSVTYLSHEKKFVSKIWIQMPLIKNLQFCYLPLCMWAQMVKISVEGGEQEDYFITENLFK